MRHLHFPNSCGNVRLPEQQWVFQPEKGASDAPEGKEGIHPGPLLRWSCVSPAGVDGLTATSPSCSSIRCPVLSCPIARAMPSAGGGMHATGRKLPSLLLCGASSAIGRFPEVTGPIHAQGTFCRGTWHSKSRPSNGPLGGGAQGSIPSDSLAALQGCCPKRTRSCPGGSPLHGQYSTCRSCRIGSTAWRSDGSDGQ